MLVNVLGTEYSIRKSNKTEDLTLENADGYCDTSTKQIVVDTFQPTTGSLGNLDEYTKKVTRHELIHAFLFESGLSCNAWANNEEIVDWIAIQFPKMLKAFEETECL
jgi:hypothetical protein